jgi:Tfp pilus assembly protein PilF
MKYIDEENNQSTGDSRRNEPDSNMSKRKGLLLTLLGIAILGGIIYGANQLKKETRDSSEYKLNEIANLEAEEQKKILEDQLKEFKLRAENLTSEADIDEKYRAYIRLAELQNRLGLHQDALNSLDKVPQEKTNNSIVSATYAIAYQGVGDNSKAKESISKAISIDNYIPEYWISYFEIYQDLDPVAKDAKFIEALKISNNNIELVKMYAKFLESQGNKEKAIIYWEVARNVDPANASTYEAEIQRLRQ